MRTKTFIIPASYSQRSRYVHTSFTAPPLPYYISGGYTEFQPGQKHLNRRNIGVFELLVVTNGCTFTMQTFTLAILQFARLLQPATIREKLLQVTEPERKSYHNRARWKHPLIFQQILELFPRSLLKHS